MERPAHRKPLFWVGSSRKDLREFPEEVKDAMGHALDVAQLGGKHPDAKPLAAFGGAGVLEVVEDFAGDAYRAVYTVRFAGAVYVLHAFQKKFEAWHSDSAAGCRPHQGAAQTSRGGT